MNRKADVDGLTVKGNKAKFNSNNVYCWFRRQGGKEKSPREKPMLTPEMKRDRKKWCEDMKKLVEEYGDNFYACFLDEKWFYTTSCRRKLKILPAGPGETDEEVAPVIPTTRSRQFPIKVRVYFYI